MKLIDIVRLAALNLWRRRLRTVLTILGVIIGTACIMVMIAMGIGNMEQFDENFMKNADLTQINVYNEGERNASSSNMLNDKAIATFKQIPNVSAATGVLQLYLFIRIGKYETYTDVNAVEPAFIENMELYKGTVSGMNQCQRLFLAEIKWQDSVKKATQRNPCTALTEKKTRKPNCRI